MARVAEHPANRGDAIRDEEREHPVHVRFRRLSTWDVRVHLGHARHQELAPAVDASGIGRHLDLAARPHGHDRSPRTTTV